MTEPLRMPADMHPCLDFDAAVDARRSVRAFRRQPVPRALLEHVFALAGRAPSNCNTQPWLSVVASGAACERMRERLSADFTAGRVSMDFPYAGRYEGMFRDRQYDAAARLYAAMGIAREDKTARNAAFMRNFRFFDAPHVAFLFLPEWGGLREAADLGMYAQTLMLALAAHGLASCPQTALSFAADAVREELDVEPRWKLVFGISLGYEDEADPANACRVPRAPLADSTRFVD
jgi:hypothetical protein